MHGPQFLIDYDLIIVTVNYRLGPLGQLSLDTGLVSGNQVTTTHHHPDIRLFNATPKTFIIVIRGCGTRVWRCTGSRRISASWGETGPG